MLPYWQQYIDNARSAAEKADFTAGLDKGFAGWYAGRRSAENELSSLKRDSTLLLGAYLFPCLDELHSASEETLGELSAFADKLLDWKVNLDPGIYVTIHDAMLNLYRVRRDRNALIRELYKLGMGYNYMNRHLNGIADGLTAPFRFQNELLFTEASSYMRYFEAIEDEETRGYILRSLANIALCTRNHKRKIATSARVLAIVRDSHYRALAPGLPWDRFERATHQQMSANRVSLSRGDLNQDELAAVLDSCYEVFKVEQQREEVNPRWLWPYYEMEYTCGYATREQTLDRLEELIAATPFDRYDIGGLYGNIYLALVYGEIMKKHPELKQELRRVRFLNEANRKMLRTLMTCPASAINDDVTVHVANVLGNYNETGCEVSYRQVALSLMQRFAGETYIQGRRRGEIVKRLCRALLASDPAFFDDIPQIRALPEAQKGAAVDEFAHECSLLCDIGLVKMGISRIRTRGLLESEHRMYLLHAVSGHDDLSQRESTAAYADTALGHHSRYDGAQPLPGGYERTHSPTRQMTDAVCVAMFLQDEYAGDMNALLKKLFSAEGTRFSPMITACLNDKKLAAEIENVLKSDPAPYYREVYEALAQERT